jgi:hypothetical protein
MKKEKIFNLILILFLIFFFITEFNQGYEKTKDIHKRLNVIKISIDWLNNNSSPKDKILVGDQIVYKYFTNNSLRSYSYASQWAVQFCQQNQINDILYGYAGFMFSENIRYFIAYDSTMNWFYKSTEDFALRNETKEFQFAEQKIIFKPLKTFNENKQTIILYEVIEEE